MTRYFAAEWAEHDIRVNLLSPGYMNTRLNATSTLTDVLSIWLVKTSVMAHRVEELTGPVLLFTSKAGSFLIEFDFRIHGGAHCSDGIDCLLAMIEGLRWL